MRRVPRGHGGIEFPFKAGIRLWNTKSLRGFFQYRGDFVVPYYFEADEFPLSKASIRIDQIKRKKNRVTYKLEFDYVYNDKPKDRTEKLKFEPVEELGENKIDFQNRKEIFLLKIDDFMNSNIGFNLEEGKK